MKALMEFAEWVLGVLESGDDLIDASNSAFTDWVCPAPECGKDFQIGPIVDSRGYAAHIREHLAGLAA